MSNENMLKDSDNDASDSATLSKLFDNAFEIYNSINNCEEPTNSSNVQANIKRTMNMLEDATRLVSLVDMFSENESFDEVPTENIKYFLLPALLGTLTTKICGSDDRMHIVTVAEIYYLDFLKRVKSYGLTDIAIPEPKSGDEIAHEDARHRPLSNAENIAEMVYKRNTKLRRYKECKQLKSQLETLEKNLSNPNIDDETKREYFVTLIKLYVNTTIDELTSLATEKRILEQMKMKGIQYTTSSQHTHKNKAQTPKLQPIIITRDEVQKKVYGAGYPSLPIYTVEEFYEQKIRDGEWADPSKHKPTSSKCLQNMVNQGTGRTPEEIEAEENEEKVERDDPELLAQARAMDEYKDTHRRGWGNRANRS